MKTAVISGLIGAYLTIEVGDHFNNDTGGKDSRSEDFIVDHIDFPQGNGDVTKTEQKEIGKDIEAKIK